MAEIDYFLFPLSPFSYLAGLELEAVAARQGATIAYRPVQLFRIFAEVGTPQVKDRHPSKQRYRLQDIARLARAKAMPVNLQPRHWPTNPMPASAAIVTAQGAGGGDLGALVHGFLRAVWAEERDIAEDETVRAILAAAGLRSRARRSRAADRGRERRAQHRRGAAPRRVRDAELCRRRRGVLGAGPPAAARGAPRRAGGVAAGRPAQPSAADGPE